MDNIMDYENEQVRDVSEQALPIKSEADISEVAAFEDAIEETAPAYVPTPALTAVSAKKKAPRLEEAPAPEESAADEPPAPSPDERVFVCDVQFRPGSKIYFFDPGDLNLKNGDHVIIDTARGAEYGYCIIGNHRIARRELVQPLRRVLRVATPIDERIKAENERREKEAYAFCLRKIEDLGLDMQLVSCEYAFDGSKLLFFFTADARVDFRELVKILAANFHTRIELRQIGVRDKAKMLGGLGICGRPFCCAGFLEDFQPVSIKMAKTQNLSLNPAKISGTCGRLMCCLKYEQEAYEDLIKTSPKLESFVDTPDGRGTVLSVNLMHQSVTVRMEKDEEIHTYRNSEICILRSGKAKKNDPPIPEALAPISGRKDGELRERRPFLDQRLTLDSAESERFTSELEAEKNDSQPGQEPRPHRNRRERKPNRWENAQAAALSEPRQEEEGENAPAAPAPQRPGRQGRRDGAQPFQGSDGGNAPRRNRKGGQKPAEQTGRGEKPERIERADKYEKPSRQQRRHQQQGRPEVSQPERAKHPAPEKRSEEQTAPKPEGAKKPNRRRYYHNRKPNG